MIPSHVSLSLTATAASWSPLAGRLAFAAVFLALVLWLLLIPRSRLADSPDHAPPPPWRNARIWAIAIAILQGALYLFWH